MTRSHRLTIGLSLGWLILMGSHPLLGSEQANLEAEAPSTVFLPSPASPLVAFRFVFRVGSQNDRKGKEGLAALTAAMISEGGTKTSLTTSSWSGSIPWPPASTALATRRPPTFMGPCIATT